MPAENLTLAEKLDIPGPPLDIPSKIFRKVGYFDLILLFSPKFIYIYTKIVLIQPQKSSTYILKMLS